MKISDRVVGIGRSLVAELERDSEGFRALRDGETSRELYIEFLVQHFKYARVTVHMLATYASAMAENANRTYRTIGTGAARHAVEETGHDDHVLDDLGALWGCSREEALRRVEAMPSAPAVDLYLANVRTTLEKFPSAIAGLTAVLETVAVLVARRALESLLAVRPFPGCELATRWLTDHSEDEEHVEAGRMRVELLEGAYDTIAAHTLAAATAVLYRDIWRYMDALHAGNLRAPLLAGAAS